MLTLPPVLVLHLKRFEHSLVGGIGGDKGIQEKAETVSRKVDIPVLAPDALDIRKYCADVRPRAGEKPWLSPQKASSVIAQPTHYDLHAIVVHRVSQLCVANLAGLADQRRSVPSIVVFHSCKVVSVS